MPTVVDIPEVGEVEFPDDMDENAIAETIRTKIAAPALPEDIPLTDSGPSVSPAKVTADTARLGMDMMLLPTKFDWYGTLSKDEKEVQIAQAEAQAALDQPKRDVFEVNDLWITDPEKAKAGLQEASQSKVRAEAMRARHEAVRPATPEEIKAIEQQTEQDNYIRFMEAKRKESFIPDVVDTALGTVYRNTTAIGATLAQTLAPSMGGAASADLSNRIAESQAYLNTADSMGASIGKGVGEVASLIAGNPAGLPGVAVAASKAAAMAYGQTLAETGSASKAGEAALATAPMLALYMGIGYGAARGVNAMLPKNFDPMKLALASGAGATVANIGTTAAMNMVEGREYGLQELTADTLFGIFHGYGEYGPRKAAMDAQRQEQVQRKVEAELLSRGFAEEQIYAPYQPDSPFRTQVTPAYKLEPRVEPVKGEATAAEAVAADRQMVEPEVPAVAPEAAAESERLMGPGAANIEEPFFKLPSTSNKEAVVNQERALENLDPVIKEARISNVESVDRAETILDQNPQKGKEIVERLRSQNPQERTIALEDSAILLVDRVRLKNERALNEQRALDENNTAEERQIAQNEVARLSGEIYALDAAAQGARSTWGRFGQLWQRTMRDDFTFDAMERRAALSKGKPLTEPERQRVKQQSEEIQKAEDAFEKRRTQLEEEIPVDETIKAIEAEAKKDPEFTPEVQSLADRIAARLDKAAAGAAERLKDFFSNLGKTTFTGADIVSPVIDLAIYGASKIAKGLVKFGQWGSSMVKDFGDGVKPYLEEAWAAANKNIDDAIASVRPKDPAKVKAAVTKVKAVATAESIGEKMKERAAAGEKLTQMRGDIQKLVETLVRGGIKERGALVDAVQEVLVQIDPAVTRRQTSDAISGYGDFKPLNKDAVKIEVRDLKGQLQQVSKLEDIQSKVPLKRTGVERRIPSTEERALIQQVNEAKKKFGVVVTDPEKQLKSATDAIETRLENQIKDITRQIETGEPARTKTPAPTNERIEQLRALRDRVQSTLNELRGKPQATVEQRAAILRKSLEAQIADLERRSKTGDTSAKAKPPEVRTAEIDALKARRDALRAELDELRVVDEAVVEERKFDATMKSIADLEVRLAAKDTSPTSKRKLGPDTEMVAKAKENLTALRQQMKDLRKAENPPKPEEQRKLEAAMKAVQKSIEEYDRRLRVGDMAAKMKKGVTSPELEALRAERDAMRALFTELRDGPKRTKEEIAIAAMKARLTKQIADKLDRIARGDFAPAPKRPPLDISKDPEAMRLKAESERVKAQYEQDRLKAEFAAQNFAKKALRLGRETLNLPRAILSSWDLSAVLRQGGVITLGNPVRAARATGAMFKALVSERSAREQDASIRSRPNAPLYEEAGLYLAPIEDVRISRQEEAIMSEFAQKIPGIKASNRAYVTFLNRLRADSFDAMVASLDRPGAPLTPTEMQAIANYINVATGRGDLGKASQAATTLSTIFFSPRLLASRFQVLARPLMGFRQGGETSMRVRKAVAKEYGKLLLGLGTIYGLAKLSGASVEEDPRSSDFGKIRFGNTRIDPLAGLAQVTTLLSRVASGEKKSVSGNIIPLRGDDMKYGADDVSDIFFRFLRTKFTPVLGTAVNIWSGRDVVGNKVVPFERTPNFPYIRGAIPELMVPLGFRDVADVMKEQGIPRGLVMELLNLFGWGLQHYNSMKNQ